MVAPNIGGVRTSAAWPVAAMASIGVLFACATPQSTEVPEAHPTENLTDVRVDHKGEASFVTLIGVRDSSYTTSLREDPPVLVVDLADVKSEAPSNLIVVYDGLVKHVSLSTFAGEEEDEAEAVTRVEIALTGDVEYEVAPGEEGLDLALWPREPGNVDEEANLAEAGEITGEETPVTQPVGDPWSDPEAASLAVEPGLADEEMAAFSAPPDTKLEKVNIVEVDGGILVHLAADGIIDVTQTFTLEDPARLVVDLPGLASEVEASRIEVKSNRVARVRVGAHPDKVRVVIDGAGDSGDFGGRRVTPAPDGLLLALGSGPDLDQALADALDTSRASVEAAQAAAGEATGTDFEQAEGTAPGAEAIDGQLELAGSEPLLLDEDERTDELGERVEEGGAGDELAVAQQDWEPTRSRGRESEVAALESPLVEVYGIHYDSQSDQDRVVVLSESILDHEVYRPDPETLIVSLLDAKISREAAGRIYAKPNGPISVISAFQQPDVERPEVRVVVKRAAGLEPTITRRGALLFIDFPRNGSIASPAPAFPEAGADPTIAMTGSDQRPPAGAQPPSVPAEGAPAEPVAGPAELGGAASITPVPETPEVPTDGSPLPEYVENEGLEGPAGLDLNVAPTPSGPGPEQMPVAEVSPGPGALEPPAALEMLEEGGLIDGKEYVGRRISLDFKDVPVADVLRLIAEVSDLNLIAGDEVTGNVTIRLVDVPWDQALDVILLTKGLGFVRVGNVLRIAPADILKAEEEVRLQERRNKETLEDLVVKLQPVNYANVKDMSDLVKRLLTARGTVNTDARTNTLIIKDIPSVIDEATALVKAIDTETPQVLIESKIVEANLDFSRELGSVWSIGTQPYTDAFSPTTPRRDLGGEDFRFHGENNVVFSNWITTTPTMLANLGAFVLDEQFDIQVQLQAMESTGDGKVISSPRVITLDNREAEIQQGVSIPFQTFENGDAKLEFVDAVLSLLVTPHITADKSIIMQVEVTRNAPDDTVSTPTGSPAIARAEARTEALVKDGQTLVLGGIYTVVKSERQSRVPYLHRIPVLGAAFKSREVTDSRKELLIFVTPRIVVSPELASN